MTASTSRSATLLILLSVLLAASPRRLAADPDGQTADDPLFSGGPTVLTGGAKDDYFGYSVAAAGDVNNDGYADVIVGASGYGSNTGRAYVYMGGPSGLATTPATILTGEATSNFFGRPAATAGDVNGDGYADVIVGAYGYGSNTGRAYVYHGGASGLAAAPSRILTGENASDRFGWVSASAGDVDDDGYDDIIVGARTYGSSAGRAYVYRGGPDGVPPTPAWVVTGEAALNYFGWAAASAGDLNGDGYGDVVVGAQGYDTNAGRVYVYLGGPGGLSISASTTLDGENDSDYFGYAVSTAGDVDGDGYADLIVGAPYYSGHAGRAYLYLGGARGLSTTATTILTGAWSDYFAGSVATAGDVNGDGHADVVIGEYMCDSARGCAYVFLGGAGGLAATPIAQWKGELPNAYLGFSATTAGDVNRDGYADVIVGSRGYDFNRGRAYLYLGGGRAAAGDFTGDGTSDILWRGPGGDLWLWGITDAAHASDACVGVVADANWEVKGQGDLNGDGMADLLWRHKLDGTIYYWQMDGATPAAESYVATVDVSYDIVGTGDFDGDGKADILWRNPALGDLWLWRMNGATVESQSYVDTVDLSYAVRGLGDVNGDLKADVVWQGAAGDVWAWLMHGAVKDAQAYVGTVADPHYQIQQVADFDADLKADLLWWNTVQGDLWIWRLDGADVLSEHYVGVVADTTYRIQAAGDYNGDGKADILWRNIAQGDLWVWLMNGAVKESEHYVGTVPDTGYQIITVK